MGGEEYLKRPMTTHPSLLYYTLRDTYLHRLVQLSTLLHRFQQVLYGTVLGNTRKNIGSSCTVQ